MSEVIVDMTALARKRVEALGLVAEAAVEDLAAELERTPRLGVLVGTSGDSEIYKTRMEGRQGMPGLAVAYLYTPQPPPQTVAIVSVVPDDTAPAD
ncbi:hypothetical protein [Streptomyces sp. NPDC048603]|uniref:hypothetical protein n=1 Tax=Streptomyces sp. NPDC048603 TaxID=3365577 RepID=UPI0037240E3A